MTINFHHIYDLFDTFDGMDPDDYAYQAILYADNELEVLHIREFLRSQFAVNHPEMQRTSKLYDKRIEIVMSIANADDLFILRLSLDGASVGNKGSV